MSRKPQANTHWHDSSATNCVQHAAAVRAGVVARIDRRCTKCRYANRRRAVRGTAAAMTQLVTGAITAGEALRHMRGLLNHEDPR